MTYKYPLVTNRALLGGIGRVLLSEKPYSRVVGTKENYRTLLRGILTTTSQGERYRHFSVPPIPVGRDTSMTQSQGFRKGDSGLVETVVSVVIGVGGAAAAAAPILAVSEGLNRNVQFIAAFLAAFISFGIILGFFAKKAYLVITKIEHLDSKIDSNTTNLDTRIKDVTKNLATQIKTTTDGLEIDIAKLDAKASYMGRKQVTLEKYNTDRAHDQAMASKIFGIAEINRQIAEDAGIEGLHQLPFEE